ncbi:bifunctional DNA primase/helicase [Nostoc sp. RF31YmG]|nr:bifunctional DNA primase/helicase [Nostoc sp. RF31YmG]
MSGVSSNDQLMESHWQEWVIASSVDPILTALNVCSVSGPVVYEYLLYALPQTARRNDGRLRDGYLKQYAHTTQGGWWVSGLDPQNNWKQMEWGRFKPDHPRIEQQKNKPVKYESPPKTPNRVTYFDVPNCIWDKVARRYNIKRYHSPLALRLFDRLNPRIFWEWVQLNREIPIILCEGEKKAACLLSQGFVAIALPGIWNGRVGTKDFDERLHPDLIPLAQPGRKFIILFDYETKLRTRWSVYQATVRTAKAIEKQGCTPEIALLPGPEKGVDDFVVERGESALREGFPEQATAKNKGEDANALLTAIIDDAKSLLDYQRSFLVKHRGLSKYKPQITVNVKYLTQALKVHQENRDGKLPFGQAGGESPSDWAEGGKELLKNSSCVPQHHPRLQVPPLLSTSSSNTHEYKSTRKLNSYHSPTFLLPSTGLVVLLSDMGTGKTELMRCWRDAHPDQKFLNNGHRVNLLKNLALRLKTEMYSDLGYAGLAASTALSVTIDSLHKLNTQALTYGCVFIDEACQYLTHLLHSKTCKEHRAEILEVLHYIVYNAPLMVIADAHMDDVTIDFFRAMRPLGEEPFIIKNEWKNGERTIYWYEGSNTSALVAQISASLMVGQKIMVVSDSKRFIKKLEQSLNISMRIEQSGPESLLQDSPVLPSPASPVPLRVWAIHSENSGSEENVAFIKDITNAVKNLDALLTSPSLGTGVDIPEYHFDVVFGAFHGVSQTATECAQQLWRYRPKVPVHVWVAPKPPFGYLDTNATKIKQRLLHTNEMTAFLLRIDRQTGIRGAEKDWAMEAYCQIQASRHQSINNLRADLRQLLTQMGNTIIPMGNNDHAQALELLKKAASILDSSYNCAVAKAKNISLSEYRARQAKDYKKPDEVFECEKFRIHDSYGMEVTPTLVEKDDGGRLIQALASLEAILLEPNETIVDSSTGKVYPIPPALVTDKDHQERNKFPLCMDWGNYSAKWLARFNLGLHHILKRLISGDEVTATDPDLLRMTKIAQQCAAHIKAILGFTVPSSCQPMWLLGVLIEQLGLKLTSRKIGKRGQQVKFYSLSQPELDFALAVIAHREGKRKIALGARRGDSLNSNCLSPRASRATQALPNLPVSTPPYSYIESPKDKGVDTTFEQTEVLNDSWWQRAKYYAQLMVEAIESGTDVVIQELLSTLTTDERWGVMLEFESANPQQFAQLVSLAPNWVEWMG